MTPFRLLVVDDSPRDLQLFECLIEDLRLAARVELACEKASSGLRALELLERGAYDAVVLDQEMPEMSGSEVMAALRARYPQRAERPRVLAYSSCTLPDIRGRCLADGADAFAHKYMQPADLARVLREFGLEAGAAP